MGRFMKTKKNVHYYDGNNFFLNPKGKKKIAKVKSSTTNCFIAFKVTLLS